MSHDHVRGRAYAHVAQPRCTSRNWFIVVAVTSPRPPPRPRGKLTTLHGSTRPRPPAPGGAERRSRPRPAPPSLPVRWLRKDQMSELPRSEPSTEPRGLRLPYGPVTSTHGNGEQFSRLRSQLVRTAGLAGWL